MAVITISREFGAGGRTVGAKVAEKMGYALVDEEIIERVAKMANVSKQWVQSIEKEAGGRLLKFISGLGPFRRQYVEDSLEKKKMGYIDENIYVELMYKIHKQLADEGDVVILGRGGQYVLADYPQAYHFLLVADFDQRVRFMMDNYGLSERQAAAVVTRQGKRRLILYRSFGKDDYDNPLLYHAVMNMTRTNLEQASEAMCALVRAFQEEV